MANEQKVLQRCISKLDGMSHGLMDNRPKSLEKLKNTLMKETQVIYINQILIYLLTQDFTVPIKNEEHIHKADSELDLEIAEKVLQVATEQGRQVFVLPCDSDMHREVETKLTEWYNQKLRKVDPANPILEIASACTLDACLDVDRLIKRLEELDIVHQWQDLVSYKLPDEKAFEELMKVWDEWMEKIRTSLGETSACTYQLFSSLIRDANTTIQDCRIEEIGKYCEEMFASKYPKYRSKKMGEVKTEAMETSEENGSVVDEMDPGVYEENQRDVLNAPLYLLPICLDPEVAHVILKLVQAEKRPENMHDLRNFIKSIGDNAYVVSPKHILSKIAKETKDVYEDEEIVLNVRLGSIESKKTIQLKDTNTLGAILTFPGKNRILQGKSFRLLHHSFDHMDTSRDRTRDILRGFQEYILKTAKLLSQRTGAQLLFDDADANNRCGENLRQYLASLLGGNGISEEEFSKELARRSYEFTTVPVEELVNLLMNAGYLTINETDMSITYTPGYRKQKHVDTAIAESSYLREWERFYKQKQEPSEEMGASLFGRKRKFKMPTYSFYRKKPKIINI